MKKFRSSSSLAFILVVCMLMAMCTPVMAATYVAPVSGNLLLPPSGTMSSVPVTLMAGEDGSEAAVSGAAVTLSDNTAGVYKSGSNLILDKDLAKAGSVTVNAASGDTNASATMLVSPYIFYEDFEGGTVGNAVTTTKIEKISDSAADKSMFAEVDSDTTATALIAGDETNKYGDGFGVAGATFQIVQIPLDDVNSNGKVTIKAKILRKNGDAAASYPGIQLYDKNGATLLNFRFLAATTTSNVWSKVSAAGASASGNGVHVGSVSTEFWYDVILELDLINGTYDAVIGHTITLSDYKMLNTPTNVELGYIQFGVRVDDIAVYSGTSYESTNSVTGPETIYAPSAGKSAKVDGYGVVDSNSAAVANATLSLADSYAGMQLKNNALVIGNGVTAGNKYLVATDANGDFLAKGTANVADVVYYEDFEDAATYANTAKISTLNGVASDIAMATTETPVATEGENTYADAKAAEMTIDLGENQMNSPIVTFSADIRVGDIANGTEILNIKDSNNLRLIGLRYVKTSTYARVRSRVTKDGAYIANGIDFDQWKDPGTDWFNIRVVINFDTDTYDLYFNNQLVCDDWKVMNTNASGGAVQNSGILKSVACIAEFDNIEISTGAPYYIVADSARLSIPASGETSTAITAKYNDGTAVSNLTVTTSAEGISTEANNVKVSSSALVAPVTVALSDGLVSGTATFEVDKDFVLLNGTAYDGSSALAEGQNIIHAYYGASDMKAGNIIYIARYSVNGELKSLEKVVSSATTATEISTRFTDTFAAGDIAKVFVWENSNLKPIKLVEIQ